MRDVRIDKLVEIELASTDRASGERELAAMCETLLANPVIEDFKFELV